MIEFMERRRRDHMLIMCAALGLISALVVGMFVVPTVLGTSAEQKELNRQAREIAVEGRERRDQTCTVFERQHLADVDALRSTYRYLKQLTPDERHQTLNRFILRSLPAQELEARTDQAPAFCDEPGAAAEKRGAPPVGLPEPDPIVPKRPPGLLP